MSSVGDLFGSRIAQVVPDAIDRELARGVRERLRFTRYALVDRGSYDFVVDVSEPALAAAVTAVANRVTGRALVIVEARAVRLGPGDYILAHHDQIHEGHPIEVIADLSPAPVPAEVHYRRRGQVYFRVPSTPGSVAIVERGPTVTCNHTYVSKLHAGASVVRYLALLR